MGQDNSVKLLEDLIKECEEDKTRYEEIQVIIDSCERDVYPNDLELHNEIFKNGKPTVMEFLNIILQKAKDEKNNS